LTRSVNVECDNNLVDGPHRETFENEVQHQSSIDGRNRHGFYGDEPYLRVS